ncbi:hypothetical protein WICPIJ_006014 [Wickerhamomyces pijperi]|uniref:Growth regulation protein n=1 Tax=Wickerhamomyces pijperi TaxID=599730 RepID=A0A9P8Q4I8_WICPI|nr:hypothetical protein WICPIJ_006014 [Wickerhamomyces pijperi]
MSHNDIITQVTPEASGYRNQQFQQGAEEEMEYATVINLNIRGEMFKITRDELMNLPESILLCLFPNGVFVDMNGNQILNLSDNDVVYVNFDPVCFQYIVDSFSKAAEHLPVDSSPEVYDAYQTPDAEVLNDKPAIIVLREDLDYYVIPPHKGLSPQNIRAIKAAAGSYLVSRTNVFEGLGYGKKKRLGPAEEHLLEMLCSSGFEIESNWGHRTTEPNKTVLTSLALVDLKNPEPPTPTPEEDTQSSNSLAPVASNASGKQVRKSRLATLASTAARSASRSVSRNRSQTRNEKKQSAGTSSKLLLFWRKPARKCWWSDDIVTLKVPGIMGPTGLLETIEVSLHIRRVWTLELSVIGVH